MLLNFIHCPQLNVELCGRFLGLLDVPTLLEAAVQLEIKSKSKINSDGKQRGFGFGSWSSSRENDPLINRVIPKQ